MQRRSLGKTGYQIGVVGFGGNRVGNVAGMDDAAWTDLLLRARERGVNLFDSSPNYGRSEELLGRALGDDPAVVFATKCPPERDRNAADQFAPSSVRTRCETSLRLLRRDIIDIYQLHSPSAEALRQSDWLPALIGLRDEGKIRAVAVSTNHADSLRWLITEGVVDAVQVEYSLLAPGLGDLIALAASRGVGVLVQMPLSRGILSGKFLPGQEVARDHRATLMGERLPRLIEQAEAFRALEGRASMSLSELALRWALAPPGVSCIIPGARNRAQLEANVRAGDGMPLPDSLLRAIEAIQRELGLV